MKKISKPFSRSLLHLIIIITAFIWILPTVGLLITSFRPPPDVAASGWWTVFEHPFNFTCYSLENYQRVIAKIGLGGAFMNTLFIAIPSTIIPICCLCLCLDGISGT